MDRSDNIDTVNPHVEIPFDELQTTVQKLFPSCISRHIDTLYRIVWNQSEYEKTSISNRLRWKLSDTFYLEKRYRSSIEYNRSDEDSLKNTTALVPFRPSRADYQPLLFPVTNELTSRGIPTTVCAWKSDHGDSFEPDNFPNAELLYYDSVFDFTSYLRAKRRYRSLAENVSELCSCLNLGYKQTRRTVQFFKQYALNLTLFERVLDRTEPDMLYNIHYVTTPGFVEAINQYKRHATLTNALIQHGWFAWYPFHPHRKQDADISILWGEHFAERLDHNNIIPPTPTKVIGNPKLEHMRRHLDINSTGEDVLYASSPTQRDYVQDALRIVSAADEKASRWEVTYKPHPNEDCLKNYKPLLNEGLIDREQIIKDTSVHDLIVDSRIVVGTHSSVLLEALALDRVAIQLLPKRADNSWAQLGMYTSDSKNNFLSLVDNLVENTAFYDQTLTDEQYLRDQMFEDLETASEQIVKYLLQTQEHN